MEGFDIAGNYLESGLPNIKGETYSSLWTNNSSTANYSNGVIREYYSSIQRWDSGGNSVRREIIGFDASWANPIYKDDCTIVQPPAYTVRYYIRAK